MTAAVTINDNDATTGPNPIDQTAFFVRQHYIDFLAREPDPGGFQGWQDVINNCPPGNTTCDRIHVSGGFFQSPEFQQRGYFVYRFYPVAIGRKPDYAEFIPDLASVSGFLSDAQLEAARVAFVNDFMTRPNFVTALQWTKQRAVRGQVAVDGTSEPTSIARFLGYVFGKWHANAGAGAAGDCREY